MRRPVLLALLALTVLSTACGATQRPEGIVERWLVSLNQGAAGDPSAYAPEQVSQQVVPGWQQLDPGELDQIDVAPARTGADGLTLVPFRVVTIDGETTTGLATVSGTSVANVALGDVPDASFGTGWHLAAPGTAWLVAIIAAAALAALALALVAAVRRTTEASA